MQKRCFLSAKKNSVDIKLNINKRLFQIRNAIYGLTLSNTFGINVGDALRALREDQYQENRGDRPTVNNVAIVILAQRDNNDVSFSVTPRNLQP